MYLLLLMWVKQRCPIPRPDRPTRRQKPDPNGHRCPRFHNTARTDIVVEKGGPSENHKAIAAAVRFRIEAAASK
jgi:hypothetical protein